MKKFLWIAWALVTIGIGVYYLNIVFFEETKEELLIGHSTYGHYQIELACTSCHTEPFGGKDILQDACLNCHEEELKLALDSHPKKKFNDPRNADLLEIIDARYCISCHTEHQHEQTLAMGLTVPSDYCFHCHVDIGEERESHQDLAFDSCADAGCHNFHDNRALYEAFLVKNANQPWLNEIAKISSANNAKQYARPSHPIFDISHPEIASAHPDISSDWQASAHATAGVSCVGCHNNKEDSTWIDRPGLSECQSCHRDEVEGFTSGKHGMRLAGTINGTTVLPAITPNDSHLTFQQSALSIEHGCNTCHAAHNYDRKFAATDSCLNCHADEHSLAFTDSPHGSLWQKELAGEIPAGTGVSCATCHLPSIEQDKNGTKIVRVEHNQNMNLRPNEKMVRPVCMQCHGLAFSIDALADENLIKNNFNGTPSVHVPSIDWALKRENR